MMLDPLSALVMAISEAIKMHKLNEWAKLMVSLCFSFWTSGSFICGTLLVQHVSTGVAVGGGLISAAGAVLFLWMRSPLTKGVLLAIPKDLVVDEGSKNELMTVKGAGK